jgi:hypothetical protein
MRSMSCSRSIASCWRARDASGGGQRVDGQFARDRDHVVEARLVEREAPHQADRQRRDHENDRDREVDLEIEPLHEPLICA